MVNDFRKIGCIGRHQAPRAFAMEQLPPFPGPESFSLAGFDERPSTLAHTVIRMVSRMPVDRLHLLAKDLGEPLARLAYRRELVHRNLRRALPAADTGALARAFYAALSQVALETARSLAMDADELRQRVDFEGAEALRDGKAVLLMAHHGNLVWAVTALAAHLPTPPSVVYKPPHLEAVSNALLAIAARFGVHPVPVKEVRRQLVKSRQAKRVWTLVADQRPGKERCYATLCGRRTAFVTGPERIARAMNWPAYYLSCQRIAPARYRCVIERIAEPPFGEFGQIMTRYAQKLQADIDQAPGDWLWSHDRWRE